MRWKCGGSSLLFLGFFGFLYDLSYGSPPGYISSNRSNNASHDFLIFKVIERSPSLDPRGPRPIEVTPFSLLIFITHFRYSCCGLPYELTVRLTTGTVKIGNNHLVLIRIDIIVVAALDHLFPTDVADTPLVPCIRTFDHTFSHNGSIS